MSDIVESFERHLSYPNPDGSIPWLANPIFSRADWWAMLGAANALGALDITAFEQTALALHWRLAVER